MPAVIYRAVRFVRPLGFAVALLALLLSGYAAGFAAGPPPVQTFFIPLPENHVLQALRSIYPGSPTCAAVAAVPSNPINTYVSISIISDGTRIYYDHWEDGFEVDPSNPMQGSTEIWGDGNPANGAPPGIPADVLNADTVIILDNEVNTTTLASVIDFDGGDRVSSSRIVAMSRAAWATGSETLLAGAVEVYDTFKWGRNFRAPVGENVNANGLFEYTSLSIMAASDNTSVAIDANADGAAETNITLDRGESYLVDGGVQAGGAVNASAPIQVAMITGDRCDTYESRWYVLFPDEQWSDSYYSPVGTPAVDGTRVFVYNPADTALSVSWRTVGGVQPPFNVPARGVNFATVPDNSGAHFFTANGSPFVAIAAVDATGTAGFNSLADWGFSLVPEEQLTAQILVGLGIGRDPTSNVSPNENGSPVWVTAVLPDGVSAPVDVCADYDGDNAGPLTDAFNFKYDELIPLDPLEGYKIFDPDGDQTGMVVYVCDTDANVADAKIAAAWGQAPAIASAAAPGLDLGTTAPPAATFFAGKSAELAIDPDGDTLFSPGDTVEYAVLVGNASRVPIASATISDTVPAHTVYVLGSTTFNDGVTTVAIPDSGSGTPFPLDDGGVTLTDLPVRGVFTVRFRVTINNPFPVGVTSILNVATVTVGRESADPSVETPIDLDPELVIEKSTLGIDADSPTGPLVRPGDPITWTYRITNTGEVTLTHVVVTDSVVGVSPVYVGGDNGDTILDLGESWIFWATGNAVSGQYANTGYAQGIAADGDVARVSDPSHYFGVVAGIDIDKSVDRPLIVSGDSVTYTVSISNTGNVALVQPNVSDPLCPLIYQSGDNGNGILDLEEIWRYTCTRPLTADTVNTATASGVDPLGATVTDTDTATVDVINPAIALVKTVNPFTVRAGGVVTYTLAVSNSGDVPLTNINLLDDTCSPLIFVGGDANSNSQLETTETWSYRCSTSLTVDTTNTATVTGRDPLGNTLNATDSAVVDVINPAMAVRKDASAAVVVSGSTVTYTIVVTNAGDVPLSNVTVQDNLCSPLAFVGGDANGNSQLDLAESWSYRCARPIAEDTTNTATAAAVDPLGGPVNAQDNAVVDAINPALSLQKSASPSVLLAGQGVTYTYTLTNPGDVPISQVTVTDDKCSPVTRTGGDANGNNLLEPTETWTYTCVVSVTVDTTNTATAIGRDPLSNTLTDTDTATVDVINPAIALVKTGSKGTVQPGETVIYTFTVTNAGDVGLSNVTLTDDKCSPVTFMGGDADGDSILDVAESWIYRCSAVITVQTINVATVTAQDPLGNEVSDQDSFRVQIGRLYLPLILKPSEPVPCPPPDGCPIPGVDHLKGLAVHEGRNLLYITSRDNDRLLVVDPYDNEVVAQVATGDEPWSIVVDEGDGLIYVSNYASGDVWVYDVATLAVLAKIPVGGHPALMAILPDIDVVFVVVRDGSRIAVLEGRGKIADLESGGSAPFGIAADPLNNRFFVAHRDSGHVVSFSKVNGVWQRQAGPLLEDGRSIFDLTYNPANNKLYMVYVDRDGVWFLDVWKPESNSSWGQIRTGIPVGSGGDLRSPLVGGTGIEVNRRNGHLYNVNTGAANLSVLDGNTNGVIDTIGLGVDPFAIAINNSTGTIFVGLRESGRLVKFEE